MVSASTIFLIAVSFGEKSRAEFSVFAAAKFAAIESGPTGACIAPLGARVGSPPKVDTRDDEAISLGEVFRSSTFCSGTNGIAGAVVSEKCAPAAESCGAAPRGIGFAGAASSGTANLGNSLRPVATEASGAAESACASSEFCARGPARGVNSAMRAGKLGRARAGLSTIALSSRAIIRGASGTWEAAVNSHGAAATDNASAVPVEAGDSGAGEKTRDAAFFSRGKNRSTDASEVSVARVFCVVGRSTVALVGAKARSTGCEPAVFCFSEFGARCSPGTLRLDFGAAFLSFGVAPAVVDSAIGAEETSGASGSPLAFVFAGGRHTEGATCSAENGCAVGFVALASGALTAAASVVVLSDFSAGAAFALREIVGAAGAGDAKTLSPVAPTSAAGK
ncbi:MAG TPA: hypothetical protein VHD62_15210 [Opitutaceae bacterium]|nr:hypothetical protein [Opitutaceae bacterium]